MRDDFSRNGEKGVERRLGVLEKLLRNKKSKRQTDIIKDSKETN